jgi:hypothetical protein
MGRRKFVGSATLAAVGSLAATASAGRQGEKEKGARQLLEWREYSTMSRDAAQALNGQLEAALVPALNRLGLEPVGAFSPVFGSSSATVHLLIPHPSLDSVTTLHARLLDDEEFTANAGALLQPNPDEAAYVRMKSSLMHAFETTPKIEVPPRKPRIFELRRYESHSIKAAKLKVEMFDEGEIDVFRKTGLTPVFFGETLVGDHMPNLVYMLTFEDMAQRDAAWARFVEHPDWKRMSALERYKGTVSNISDTILRPTSFSQV